MLGSMHPKWVTYPNNFASIGESVHAPSRAVLFAMTVPNVLQSQPPRFWLINVNNIFWLYFLAISMFPLFEKKNFYPLCFYVFV